MKEILLVSPDFNPGFSQHAKLMERVASARTLMMPLHLATVAALTPDGLGITLWDEAIQGEINESTQLEQYDLVGVTGYVAQLPRARELARLCRERGITVALGGPGVSLVPEKCRDDFDVLFIGEAEFTWPQFIQDWLKGEHRNEYRQVAKPDLSASPVPRWDLVEDVDRYLFGAVQTTRGCPFDCEFCDVIYLLGRRPRTKPIDQVLEEVANLESLGVKQIFCCDDNFIGDPRYAKDLLRELIPLNHSFDSPAHFSTQLTINVARDDELLALLADANFGPIFIGIETPNKASLQETNKPQNYRTDLVADVKKIQSFGLPILSSMILGFDHDEPSIFDEQFEFIQECHIPNSTINVLTAGEGTKLWARLMTEGRLVKADERHGKSTLGTHGGIFTNIVPAQMSRVELMQGYGKLISELRDWDNFGARVKGFISGVQREPNVSAREQKREIGPQAEKFRKFVFSLDENVRRSIIGVIQHTVQKTPYMLEKVLRLITYQFRLAASLPVALEGIDARVEFETSEEFEIRLEQTEILIPESFRKAYKTLFPEVYHHVVAGLDDQTQIVDALISIFVDFLTRWGRSLEEYGDIHQTYLFELADRTLAIRNSASEDQPGAVAQSDAEPVDIHRIRLADEILKAVEQKLRRTVRSGDSDKGE